MRVSFGFNAEAKGDTPSLCQQVHGNTFVWQETLGGNIPEADAVLTREPGRSIHIFTADCLPVLFFADEGAPLAAIHSGWRGAMRGVVKAALTEFQKNSPSVNVVLGPCLLSCCFEVQEDFIQTFEAARGSIDRYLSQRDGKRYFELPAFVRENELSDVPAERIDTRHLRCTRCSQPELPSYRRNGNTATRIKAWIKTS